MNVQRVLAPNPGPYTGPGTNTYILESSGKIVIIDPGPDDDSHLAAILETIADREPVGVLVTHTHEDHAPLANRLAARLHVPAAGFAPGPGFAPDRELADGDVIAFEGTRVRTIATPGHSPDHVCYLCERALFTGDHIMGGSSVFVEDMTAYLHSLERLQTLDLDVLYPGHGPAMFEPYEVIGQYIEHRMERERQILAAIQTGARSIPEIVHIVYEGVDEALLPLAAIAVRAHLRKLIDEDVLSSKTVSMQ